MNKKIMSFRTVFHKEKYRHWRLEIFDDEYNRLITFYDQSKKDCLKQFSEWVKE